MVQGSFRLIVGWKGVEMNKGAVSLAILVFLSMAGFAQQPEQEGELRIYPRATQVGTVALREFKDDKGRVSKIIYYTSGGSLEGPFHEELLREQSIHLFTYDEHGCRVTSQIYQPGLKLDRTREVRCLDGTATPSLTTVRDANGIKQFETIHTPRGGTRTVLYFDSEGDKIVAINGELPSTVDLVHGWGEPFNGLACGIAVNREKGRQEDLQVHVTIKNISNEFGRGVMISPVLVELKDIAGRVIERKTAKRTDENELRSGGCPSYVGQSATGAGRSQPQPAYSLGDQYDPLAPGKYSFTATYCVSGVSGRLVSNTILFEIGGSAK